VGATWEIASPSGAGALGVVHLSAPTSAELDLALASLGVTAPPGTVRAHDLLGVDRGVVIRWTGCCAHLYPHGGAAILRLLARRLEDAGLQRSPAPDPVRDYPEASDPIEARMLAALARAASPLAIDLLLDQPRRWRAGAAESPWSTVLNRLIDPPLVVALGAPNIGKSTLANTLAGRSVAIVADEPGTTRDHVGVTIDLAGLVVRYVDTPGLGRDDAPPEERAALRVALDLAAGADLLLLCGDAASPPPNPLPSRPALRLALRADLGTPTWPFDALLSAPRSLGLREAVTTTRDNLVPGEARRDQRAWRFWE
jgi:tRNA modification GTPase